MQSIKLSVRDFQIIRAADIVAEGVTCIVGPSNSGKTALYRAMFACLNNRTGDDFIRLPDAVASKVLVEFVDDDHMMVAWKKPRGKGAEYVIDGGPVLSTVGRTALSEIMSRGLEPLVTKRNSYHLNFWDQGTLLLVDEPSTRVFDLISELMVERELVPVLGEMKTDCLQFKKNMAAAEKSLEGEEQRCETIAAELEMLAAVDEHDPDLQGFRADLQLAQQGSLLLARVKEYEGVQHSVSTELAAVTKVREEAASVFSSVYPELETYTTAVALVQGVQQGATAREDAQEQATEARRACAILQGVPTLTDEADALLMSGLALKAVRAGVVRVDEIKTELETTVTERTETELNFTELQGYLGECDHCGAPTVGDVYVGE